MNRILIAGAAVFVTITAAVGAELTVDTSSDEAMKASIMVMVEALPSDQKRPFGEALMTLGLSDLILAARPGGGGLQNAPPSDAVASLRSIIGGKTAAEIIALADEKVPPLQ